MEITSKINQYLNEVDDNQSRQIEALSKQVENLTKSKENVEDQKKKAEINLKIATLKKRIADIKSKIPAPKEMSTLKEWKILANERSIKRYKEQLNFKCCYTCKFGEYDEFSHLLICYNEKNYVINDSDPEKEQIVSPVGVCPYYSRGGSKNK